MKRMIVESGRSTNRDERHRKSYSDVRFSGWTHTKTDIIRRIKEMLDLLNSSGLAQLAKPDAEQIKRMIRFAISECEASEIKLREYREILQHLNSSNFTSADLQSAYDNLKNSALSQIDLHTP